MKRILVAAFCLGLFACGNQEPAAPATTAPMVAMTAAPAPATAAPDPEPTAQEVPVPEDFETEATGGVSEANYRAELDRIAGEIAQQ
jgi:hypothetical protein